MIYIFSLLSCLSSFPSKDLIDNPNHDYDNDGLTEEQGDCDDNDKNIFEIVWYVDSDGDGFGLESLQTTACTRPEGYAEQIGDCNDEDGEIHPNAQEVCDDIDNNCDGSVDENVQNTYYADLDGDGLDDFWLSAYIDHKPHFENGSIYLIHGSNLGENQNRHRPPFLALLQVDELPSSLPESGNCKNIHQISQMILVGHHIRQHRKRRRKQTHHDTLKQHQIPTTKSIQVELQDLPKRQHHLLSYSVEIFQLGFDQLSIYHQAR